MRLLDGRRGRVRYLGHVDTSPGMDSAAVWIGLDLEKPSAGSGDGKLGHKRYFSCRAGHALFTQLSAIAAIEESVTSSMVYISDFI